MSRTTNVFTGRLETLHDSAELLVLRQRPSRLFRWGVWAWGVITLLMIGAFISELFGAGSTTHLVCSRATNHCERDGIRGTIPALSEIDSAALRRYHVNKQGDFYAITLHTHAGKTFDLDSYGAQRDETIASYRATVDAINKFLVDTAQQTLDTTFTYRASTAEKFRTITLLVFGLLILAGALLVYRTSRYTFEPGKVMLVSRGPFARSSEEVSADQITAIVDRRGPTACFVALQLGDGSSRVVVTSPTPDPLAQKITGVLGKPLEERS